MTSLLDSSKSVIAKHQELRIIAQPLLHIYKSCKRALLKGRHEKKFIEFARFAKQEMIENYEPDREFDIVLQQLKNQLSVQKYKISRSAYSDYLKDACYPSMVYDSSYKSKTIEHFVSLALANTLKSDSTVVDIGSSTSPFPDIVKRLYGCKVFRQDLVFAPGIHGEYIGSNASKIPLPDESVDLFTLHNSFEHFEGDADSQFIRESERILKYGGQVIIVPLYSNPLFLNQIDPWEANPFEVLFDDDAIILITRGSRARFGRHYSVAKLQNRILNMSQLRFEIFHVSNWSNLKYPKYASLVLVLTKM